MTQVAIYISNIHSQRFVSGDSAEGLDHLICPKEEDEDEKLLKQAIGLSLEEDTEEDGEEEEEELKLKKAIALSLEGSEENKKEEEDNIAQDAEEVEVDEELMLRQAIALSLEGTEKEDDEEEL